MESKPILFSTEMVKAILSGKKTQTRRVVKPQPDIDMPIKKVPMYSELEEHWNKYAITDSNGESHLIKCPYGQPGNILWVRETFAPAFDDYAYKADYTKETLNQKENKGIWKPAIHMPKKACRIFLQIKNVRVEKLQNISEKDAVSEGIDIYADCIAVAEFKILWESINGPESWQANPFVWVIEFERVNNFSFQS